MSCCRCPWPRTSRLALATWPPARGPPVLTSPWDKPRGTLAVSLAATSPNANPLPPAALTGSPNGR
eukprot:8792347-Lingulodinium_polyedra.AAC.1